MEKPLHGVITLDIPTLHGKLLAPDGVGKVQFIIIDFRRSVSRAMFSCWAALCAQSIDATLLPASEYAGEQVNLYHTLSLI